MILNIGIFMVHLLNLQTNILILSIIKKVSAALLRAAARFNSFSIWAAADNVAEFKSEKDAARDYFSNEYKKLITESLDDFETNFDTYRIDNKR